MPAPSSTLPCLAPLEPGEERRIDAGSIHLEASLTGLSERYRRGRTPHTVHVWWARRPHVAMRELVLAALDKSGAGSPSSRLLDMFGGGATIGVEAARLGAETYVVESNELAAFINFCHLVYPRGVPPDRLEPLLRESGTRVLEGLAEATEALFPLRQASLGADPRARTTTYLWTYSTLCESCGYRFFLSKRQWCTRKGGKRLAMVQVSDKGGQQLALRNLAEGSRCENVWIGRTRRVRCPNCGNEQEASLQRCRDELAALVVGRRGWGKEYHLADESGVPAENNLAVREAAVLEELAVELPTSKLPSWSGIVNPALYGMETHADFVNSRQRLTLLHLIQLLEREHSRLLEREGEETARYIVSLLSSLIDQLLDWSCRLSMWIPQNEQVGRAFPGPGVAMLWDYAEIDPAHRGPANLWDKLERIIQGAIRADELKGTAEVIRGSAQELPFPDDHFDAIVTDPPYYDNLYYSVLADFFYSWKRLLLRKISPDLFARRATTIEGELVASIQRWGDRETAHEWYCAELSRALVEASRVLKPEGVLALIYSHASLAGWEALLRAFIDSPLVVTSVQPLSIERRQRPRAMTSEVVNTCLVFVARKREVEKTDLVLAEVVVRLAEIRDGPFTSELVEAGWRDEDVALALFAQGIGLLANRRAVDRDSSLQQLEGIVQERFPTFGLKRRRSL